MLPKVSEPWVIPMEWAIGLGELALIVFLSVFLWFMCTPDDAEYPIGGLWGFLVSLIVVSVGYAVATGRIIVH